MADKKNYNFIYVGFDAHKPPVFKEARGKDWVNYGTDAKWKNRYPDYLINLYNTSPKHNAIVNGKVNYIVGQGFSCEVKGGNLLDKAKVKGFISSVGKDSLKELNYKVATDLELFGGYAVEPIISRGGDKIAEIHHIDFSKIRVAVDGERYFFTSDWSVRDPQKNDDFKTFTAFDPSNPQADSIIYYKTYRPDLQEYPLPNYIGAVPYVEAESEIANYTLNNIKSGFAGTFIINFHNGEPTADEQDYIEQAIKNKFTGSDNAGSFMLSFDDGKDRAVDVIPIQDDGHQDKFLNLIAQTGQEIFTGHGVVNPALFGVKENTGMGNNADELRTSSEAFQNRYVSPKQELLEELYNSILVFNGLPGCLVTIKTEVVAEAFSEATITQVMTTTEIRERLGLSSEEQVEVNQVAEALGTISPLVATKVLESMTVTEIRAIVGLSPAKAPTPATTKAFSADDVLNVLDGLKDVGINDDEYEVIGQKFMQFNPFDDMDRADKEEAKWKSMAFISALGVNILDLLTAHPDMSDEEIAVATGESKDVIKAERAKLIQEGNLPSEGEQAPTEKAEEETEDLLVVYKYVLRPDAPPLKGKSSRPFCRDLVNFSKAKSWTRAQIGAMSNGQGLDVFRHRGGFYNKNGVIIPYCRHIWEARLVRKK